MKTLKKIGKWLGIVVIAVAAIGFSLYLIYLKPVLNKLMTTHVVDYDKELTIIEGGGGNTGIFVSDSLVIVVDTKMDEPAKLLAERVKQLAGNKPILVVNTHYHPDHSKGNGYYQGQTIIAGGHYTPEIWRKEASEETMPNYWLKERIDVRMNNDTVTILTLNIPAHTVGDVFVYSRRRKMLFGGDVILNQQLPSLMSPGADPDGYLAAFNALKNEFVIEKIVPGHGPIGGVEILENFRGYFNDMKTAAADASKRDELVNKYKDWTYVPFLMSSGTTIDLIRKKSEASK